jgi:hypothetical protein
MMAVFAARLAGLPQPTLSKSHGSRGFSISGLPGLTQRGTRDVLLNAHVAGTVLVLRPIANAHTLEIVFYGARYRFFLMKSALLRELAIDRATAIHNTDRYPATKDSPMALRASESGV